MSTNNFSNNFFKGMRMFKLLKPRSLKKSPVLLIGVIFLKGPKFVSSIRYFSK